MLSCQGKLRLHLKTKNSTGVSWHNNPSDDADWTTKQDQSRWGGKKGIVTKDRRRRDVVLPNCEVLRISPKAQRKEKYKERERERVVILQRTRHTVR